METKSVQGTIAETHALARAVAAELGFTFDEKRSNDAAPYIRGPKGETLWFGTDSYRKKVSIHVESTRYVDGRNVSLPYGIEAEKMTVSAGRDAKAIAREITRKLLPNLAKVHAALEAQVADKHAEKNAQAHTVSAMNKSGLLSRPATQRAHEETAYFYAKETHGEIVRGQVRMKLDGLSAEQAIAILKILAK